MDFTITKGQTYTLNIIRYFAAVVNRFLMNIGKMQA